MLGTFLSLIVFIPTFKQLRLRISLSFKIILVIITLFDLVILVWPALPASLKILWFGVENYLSYVIVEC